MASYLISQDLGEVEDLVVMAISVRDRVVGVEDRSGGMLCDTGRVEKQGGEEVRQLEETERAELVAPSMSTPSLRH